MQQSCNKLWTQSIADWHRPVMSTQYSRVEVCASSDSRSQWSDGRSYQSDSNNTSHLLCATRQCWLFAGVVLSHRIHCYTFTHTHTPLYQTPLTLWHNRSLNHGAKYTSTITGVFMILKGTKINALLKVLFWLAHLGTLFVTRCFV